jgi:hypothetical protein
MYVCKPKLVAISHSCLEIHHRVTLCATSHDQVDGYTLPSPIVAPLNFPVLGDPASMIPPNLPGIVELDLSFTEFCEHEDLLCFAHYVKQDADLRVLHLDGCSANHTIMGALKGGSGLEQLKCHGC